MNALERHAQAITRRHFFGGCRVGLGSLALASLVGDGLRAAEPTASDSPLAPKKPHFAAKAKRVIYLHMAGSPPQLDMFDYKPKLIELNDQPCPDEFLKGERFAFIKGVPKLLGTPHKFKQYGAGGAWICDLLPGLASQADKLAIINSVSTDQFNHAPAQLYLHTGSARLGSPSMGSWLTYGLGSENQDLPAFVVLVSGGKSPDAGKSVWGSGYLPSVYQGVQCRTQGDPVLYVSNPDGMTRDIRRQSLDALNDLNRMQAASFGDPEILTRIEQYELAFRMQVSVPEVMSLAQETQATLAAYGAQPGGSSFANNCLLARRMVENGVRFVQLFDWGWDIHGESGNTDLINRLPQKCREIDQPITALIQDLEARGLLEETLIVWGGEFGRTPMNEKRNGSKFLGRDHHPHAFTVWMCGGGAKGGIVHGQTDELGYHAVEDKMPVQDLQATILHLMGIDHLRLTHFNQGLDARLTGPAGDAVVHHKVVA